MRVALQEWLAVHFALDQSLLRARLLLFDGCGHDHVCCRSTESVCTRVLCVLDDVFLRVLNAFHCVGSGWVGLGVSSGWSDGRIIRHFAVRGALLVVFDRLINVASYATDVHRMHFPLPSLRFPPQHRSALLSPLISRPSASVYLCTADSWKFQSTPSGLMFQVLTALGLTMMVCGLWLPITLRLR
jgi:hypothetical protein